MGAQRADSPRMARVDSAFERRAVDRAARRLSCEIEDDAGRHTAVVLDMSERGLFLRTHLEPPPGTPVSVVVRRPGGEVWKLETRVARVRPSADDGPLLTGRGLGLEIVSAPEGYFRFLEALAASPPEPTSAR